MDSTIELKEDYFKTNISVNDKETQSNKETPKLLEQILKTDFTKWEIFYYLLLLLTYTISFSHLCFFKIVEDIGLIASGAFFVFFAGFCFIYQRTLSYIITKSSTTSYCKLIKENFGSFASGFYECICFIWIGLHFALVFIVGKNFINSIYLSESKDKILPKFIYSLCFYFSMLLLNIIDSRIFSLIKKILSLLAILLGIFTWILFIIKEGLHLNKKAFYPEGKGKKMLSDFYNGINILSSSFSGFIVFYSVNYSLKQSDFSVNKHNLVLGLSFIFEFIFLLFFILEPLFHEKFYMINSNTNGLYITKMINYYNQNQEDKFHIQFCTKVFAINFLVQMALYLNFQMKTMRKKIFQSHLKNSGKNWWFFIIFAFSLLCAVLLGLFMEPLSLILINNGSFGFLINFLFPGMLILKSKLGPLNIILLLIIFGIFITSLYSVYEFIYQSIFDIKSLRSAS